MVNLGAKDQRILDYLKTNKGGLTVKQCNELLGTTELRKGVSNMKDKGYIIGDVWETDYNRYGDKVRFKRYFLLGEPK